MDGEVIFYEGAELRFNERPETIDPSNVCKGKLTLT